MFFPFSRCKSIKTLLSGLFMAGLILPPAFANKLPVVAESSPASVSPAQIFSLPIQFVKNAGQTASRVEFLSRGPGYTPFLTPTQAVFSLTSVKDTAAQENHGRRRSRHSGQRTLLQTDLQMNLVGANPHPVFEAINLLPGTASYFLGNQPENWHVNVPTFSKVKYHEVYPGISLVYYGNQRQLEYDFVTAPKA